MIIPKIADCIVENREAKPARWWALFEVLDHAEKGFSFYYVDELPAQTISGAWLYARIVVNIDACGDAMSIQTGSG